MTLRDSFDWSDLTPNSFRHEQFSAVAGYRIPYLRNMGQRVPGPVVDIYHAKDGMGHSSGNGAQASFYNNGACSEHDEEFGLKMFPSFIEAYAAYCRQWAAASEGMAPPVGRMVAVMQPERRKRVRLGALEFEGAGEFVCKWGYQTGIAVMCEDEDEDSEYRWDMANDAFQEYLAEQRLDIHLPECFDQDAVDDIDYDDDFRVEWCQEWIHDNFASPTIDRGEIEGHDWLHDYSVLGFEGICAELRRRLGRRIKMHGREQTPWDELVYDRGFNPMAEYAAMVYAEKQGLWWHWDEDDRPPVPWTSRDVALDTPRGDLHSKNVALWHDDPVIIDYGYHVLGGGNNNPGNVNPVCRKHIEQSHYSMWDLHQVLTLVGVE